MEKIIGIGNALVDVLACLNDDSLLSELSLPKGGMTLVDDEQAQRIAETIKGLNPNFSTGGCACNAILSLAYLGAQPGFIGMVGNDQEGYFLRERCKARGIEARLMESCGHTGVAYALISPGGERTFGTCLGAASMMTASDIWPELFTGYDILHVEGYLVQNHELIETVVRTAKSAGMRVSLDLASYNVVSANLPFFRQLVTDYIDIVFANEEESLAFTGLDNPSEALRALAVCSSIAVVKLGGKGSSAMSGTETAMVEARQVPVIDTTGAGDFFAGGFLYALSQGMSLEDCLRSGARMAEKVIQVVGTEIEM